MLFSEARRAEGVVNVDLGALFIRITQTNKIIEQSQDSFILLVSFAKHTRKCTALRVFENFDQQGIQNTA